MVRIPELTYTLLIFCRLESAQFCHQKMFFMGWTANYHMLRYDTCTLLYYTGLVE